MVQTSLVATSTDDNIGNRKDRQHATFITRTELGEISFTLRHEAPRDFCRSQLVAETKPKTRNRNSFTSIWQSLCYYRTM